MITCVGNVRGDTCGEGGAGWYWQSVHLPTFLSSLGIQLFIYKLSLFYLTEFLNFFLLLQYLAALHPGPSFVTISAVSPSQSNL